MTTSGGLLLLRRLGMIVAVLVLSSAAFSLNWVPGTVEGFPTPSAYTVHGPILIDGDSDFTDVNGVVSGSGTPLDPYIIENWEISAATAAGIEIRNTSAHFVISNVTIVDGTSSFDGLRLANVSNGRLEALNVSSNSAGVRLTAVSYISLSSSLVSGGWVGTYLDAVQNVSVTRATLRGGRAGIEAHWSSNLTILEANVSSQLDGITLFNTDDVIVASSNVSGHPLGFGIEINGARRFLVTGNRVASMGVGVDALFVERGTVRGNSVLRNALTPGQTLAGAGILVRFASNVTVEDNDATENGRGVRLEASRDVLVRHNRFIGNTEQGIDDAPGANAWDDGYPSGGNYWSDYAGWDDCRGPSQTDCSSGDGLGDSPYNVSSGIQDRYPLVPVNPPNEPPHAEFTVSPGPFLPGEAVTFDATLSGDPEGYALTYRWDFGDGSQETTTVLSVTHAYATPGTYPVTLETIDVRRATSSFSHPVTIDPFPEIALVRFDHPAGFRLPVPAGWEQTLNHSDGESVLELELKGSYESTPATILVDMMVDPGARESQAYLEKFVNDLLAELRRDAPSAAIDGAPEYHTIANHSAVSFVIAYADLPLRQKAALVVSEAHGRSWFFLLTGASTYFAPLADAFDRMLAGFEITLPPNPVSSGGLLLVLGGVGAAAVAAAAVAVVFWRRRKRPPEGLPPSG